MLYILKATDDVGNGFILVIRLGDLLPLLSTIDINSIPSVSCYTYIKLFIFIISIVIMFYNVHKQIIHAHMYVTNYYIAMIFYIHYYYLPKICQVSICTTNWSLLFPAPALSKY